MNLFEWKEEYSVHHAVIDRQHQQLFRLAAGLHEAMAQGAGRARLGRVLNELAQYTNNHFRSEESLMRSSKYPGYEAHKAEHVELTQRVQELQAGLVAHRFTVTVEVMQFLRKWLENHIKESDRKVASHLATKGVEALAGSHR